MRHRLSYSNVMATLAVFVALGGTSYAAITITGKNIKNGSLTGADIKKHSVQLDRLLGSLPAGAQGAKGDQGPKGDTGAAGTDATINGVAAGGDLAGTFPNPTIKAGAVGVASLSSSVQKAFYVQDNDRANEPLDTNTPDAGGVHLYVHCTDIGAGLIFVNNSGSDGSVAASNVYGAASVGHSQDFVAGNGGVALIANLGNPDRAIGHFVFWAGDGRVWTGDYTLDSSSGYCATSGLVRQGD